MSPRNDEDKLAAFVRVATDFQRPAQLLGALEQLRAGIPRGELFNEPSLKVLKEAWHAGVFGLGFETAFNIEVEVRLAEPAPFPDFQMLVDGYVLDFEVTTAREPGLGAMHKNDQTLGPPRMGPAELDLPKFDPSELTRVVNLKVRKGYAPPPPHLLVYLVLAASGVDRVAVREAVAAGGGDAFASVWVMSSTHLLCAKPWIGLGDAEGWWRVPLKVHGP